MSVYVIVIVSVNMSEWIVWEALNLKKTRGWHRRARQVGLNPISLPASLLCVLTFLQPLSDFNRLIPVLLRLPS